jgi:hypothetical protein
MFISAEQAISDIKSQRSSFIGTSYCSQLGFDDTHGDYLVCVLRNHDARRHEYAVVTDDKQNALVVHMENARDTVMEAGLDDKWIDEPLYQM